MLGLHSTGCPITCSNNLLNLHAGYINFLGKLSHGFVGVFIGKWIYIDLHSWSHLEEGQAATIQAIPQIGNDARNGDEGREWRQGSCEIFCWGSVYLNFAFIRHKSWTEFRNDLLWLTEPATTTTSDELWKCVGLCWGALWERWNPDITDMVQGKVHLRVRIKTLQLPVTDR